jgi:hypothetical protein
MYDYIIQEISPLTIIILTIISALQIMRIDIQQCPTSMDIAKLSITMALLLFLIFSFGYKLSHDKYNTQIKAYQSKVIELESKLKNKNLI